MANTSRRMFGLQNVRFLGNTRNACLYVHQNSGTTSPPGLHLPRPKVAHPQRSDLSLWERRQVRAFESPSTAPSNITCGKFGESPWSFQIDHGELHTNTMVRTPCGYGSSWLKTRRKTCITSGHAHATLSARTPPCLALEPLQGKPGLLPALPRPAVLDGVSCGFPPKTRGAKQGKKQVGRRAFSPLKFLAKKTFAKPANPCPPA